MKVMLS